jgi:hypothetical protein
VGVVVGGRVIPCKYFIANIDNFNHRFDEIKKKLLLNIPEGAEMEMHVQ